MSIFDGILENLDDVAGKLGLPADKVQALVGSIQSGIGSGGDQLAALTAAAQEHGVSLDSIKGLLGAGGEGAQGLLGKLGGMLDSDGDGNPLNDLGGLAKGFFGGARD